MKQAKLLEAVTELRQKTQSVVDYFHARQMLSDLEGLEQALIDGDQEQVMELWGDTIEGCDPWGLGEVEQLLEVLRNTSDLSPEVEEA